MTDYKNIQAEAKSLVKAFVDEEEDVDIVGQLDSLVLSYAELDKMGFNPAFIEDYLNQLRNLFLIAGIEGEIILRVIQNEEDIAELFIRVGQLEINLSNLTIRVDSLEIRVDNLEDLTAQLVLDLAILTARVDDIENILIPERMRWLNKWFQQEYLKNDVVIDGLWTMIANKTTTDRPAPQPFGNPAFVLPEIPTWVINANDSTVYSGHLYTFNEGGWITEIRAWVPELTSTTNYRFVLIRNPNTSPVSNVIEEPVLNENGWTTLAIGETIVLAGEQFLFYIDALDSGASTTWQYPWLYGGSGNLTPALGNWTKNNANTLLQINKEDGDGVDHTLELDVVINTTFTITQLDNPNKYIVFLTTSTAADLGAYYQYSVIAVDQGGAGIPDVGAGTQIRAEQPIASPTEYVEMLNYWPANNPVWGTVEGFKRYDGVDVPGVENNAYGVDLEFQRATVSEDWEVVALSGGNGGGAVSDNKYYGFNTVTDPVIVSTEDPTYTVLNEFIINTDLAAGNYELKLTVEYNMPDTNDSFLMRVISPFTQGTPYRHEAKDANNATLVTYILPVQWAGGTLTISLEGAITTGGNDATVGFSTLIWDQK